MMPLFGIEFDASAFAKNYVARRFQRGLKQFLDSLGADNLKYLVENNRDIADLVDGRKLGKIGGSVSPDIANSVSDDEVYSWIPQTYKAIIDMYPETGKKWAERQIKFLRRVLVA